ncbi:hypothetical protein THIOM_001577 [Candidatus Thiomargarita nelsonii]|uniref:Uncharacterized protein n=1 Tax=Candidatus Thiomargarita nelsonii TaxID=1003181 RepID=A0A176S3W1_9GAMM|nr:hypothetical protein THIOM_001577 [Candidatus Thiomargarita nelsonii]
MTIGDCKWAHWEGAIILSNCALMKIKMSGLCYTQAVAEWAISLDVISSDWLKGIWKSGLSISQTPI